MSERRTSTALCALILLVLISGCGGEESAATVAPAKVVTEADLTTVTLTPEAEQRLGIALASVEKRSVVRTRVLGGELLLSVAPRSGGGEAQSIFALLPPTTPAELAKLPDLQADANGRVEAARVEVEGARLALERARTLLANKLGTDRAVEEARTRLGTAQAALETAKQKRALLGQPFFEAVRQNRLWVRVPVYAGDLERIDVAQPVRVTSLGERGDRKGVAARPLELPFSQAGASASVDLYYELEEGAAQFRPGQKVTVAVSVAGSDDSLVVPAAAVLYDIHGGTWVYENTAPHTFVRHRIEVRFVDEGVAVLARGPKPGAKVVTDGVAELFGTEFGIGK